MKKITKMMALVLVFALCSGSCISYADAQAKSITFSGTYKKGKTTINLSQYTEKDNYGKGEECGNMTLLYKGNNVMAGKTHCDIVFDGAPLKKIGPNKYKAVDQGGTYQCVITVKKKSMKVKFKPSVADNGTYKLKNRYVS